MSGADLRKLLRRNIHSEPFNGELKRLDYVILGFFIVLVSGVRSVTNMDSLSVFLAFAMVNTTLMLVGFKLYNLVLKLGG